MIPARILKPGDTIWFDKQYCKVTRVFSHYSDKRVTVFVETDSGESIVTSYSPHELVDIQSWEEPVVNRERGEFLIIYRTMNGEWGVYQNDRDEPAVFTSFSDAQAATENLRGVMRNMKSPVSTRIVQAR